MGDDGSSTADGVAGLRRRSTRIVRAFAATPLVLGLAACGGDSADETADTDTASDAGSTATTAADGATTTTLTEEDLDQEVLDAFDASNEAALAAYDPADPDDPDLLATHTGEELTGYQDQLRELQGRGVSWVGTSEWSSELMSRDGDHAVVRTCVLDDLIEVHTESGEPVSPEEGHEPSPLHLDITMRDEDGVWKAAETQELEEPCDVDQYED